MGESLAAAPKSPGCPLLTLHRTLGAAPVRLTSPWAPCFIPADLPASPPKVPASHQDPLVGVVGWGAPGVSIVRRAGSHPLVLGTGLEPRWRVLFSGRIVELCRVRVFALLSYVDKSPAPPASFRLLVPSLRLWGLQILFLLHPPHLPGYFFFFFLPLESTCFRKTVLFLCVFSASSFWEGGQIKNICLFLSDGGTINGVKEKAHAYFPR